MRNSDLVCRYVALQTTAGKTRQMQQAKGGGGKDTPRLIERQYFFSADMISSHLADDIPPR
jgi:hypothetical protein